MVFSGSITTPLLGENSIKTLKNVHFRSTHEEPHSNISQPAAFAGKKLKME
jgi:hypothetical protein